MDKELEFAIKESILRTKYADEYCITDVEATKDFFDEYHKPSVLLELIKSYIQEIDRLTCEMRELAESCSEHNTLMYIQEMVTRSERISQIKKYLLECYDRLRDARIDPDKWNDPYSIIDSLQADLFSTSVTVGLQGRTINELKETNAKLADKVGELQHDISLITGISISNS